MSQMVFSYAPNKQMEYLFVMTRLQEVIMSGYEIVQYSIHDGFLVVLATPLPEERTFE